MFRIPLFLLVDLNPQRTLLGEAVKVQAEMQRQSPVKHIDGVAEPRPETGGLSVSSHRTRVPWVPRSRGNQGAPTSAAV